MVNKTRRVFHEVARRLRSALWLGLCLVWIGGSAGRYSLPDVAHIRKRAAARPAAALDIGATLHPVQPGEYLAAPPAAGVSFVFTWDSGCETPPAEAVTALEYAGTLWGSWLGSSVPVDMVVCWTSTLDAPGSLADSQTHHYHRDFPAAPLVEVYYPAALANALAGRDLDENSIDATLRFRTTVDWSYAIDLPMTGTVDFVDVALHEIAHALGFNANMYESYNIGFCGNGPFYWWECPTAYDWFSMDSSGNQLLSFLTVNPPLLGSLLKSDANFGGPNTRLANGGAPAKLYTPQIWDVYSSLVHLDYIFEDGVNELMLPTLGGRLRHPGPVALGMLQDMGWQRADGSANLSLAGSRGLGVGESGEFTATLDWSAYSGEAVTFTWEITDQGTITHTLAGIADALTLDWDTAGIKIVNVSATSGAISAGGTRSLLVEDAPTPRVGVYLPFIVRH